MKQQYIIPGYLINDARIIVNHKESKIIKKIFELCLQGTSALQIADYLNKNQIPPFRNAKEWYAHAVLKILRNKNYTGCGLYPKIIKVRDFNRANELCPLISRKENRGNHPLDGLVHCAICGQPYRRNKKDDLNLTWHCSNFLNYYAKNCPRDGIREKELVRVILQQINNLIRQPGKIELVQQADIFKTETQFKKQKVELNHELDTNADLETLLEIAQRKAQIEYVGYAIIDYQERYKKLYTYLKNRASYKYLDTVFLKHFVKDIVVDDDNHLIKITLINDQVLKGKYTSVPFYRNQSRKRGD